MRCPTARCLQAYPRKESERPHGPRHAVEARARASVGSCAGFQLLKAPRPMHAIRIDRTKPLAGEPHSGHNRYHPEIAPIIEVAEGEEVILETRDGVDGQIGPDATVADLAHLDAGRIHPLTGPVFVKGAKPGDMIEVEFVDILPQPTAFSAIVPGLGFLRDVMTDALRGAVETPRRLGDLRRASRRTHSRRALYGHLRRGAVGAEAQGMDRARAARARCRRLVLPPDAAGAVPGGRCGLEGLRTLPPRENGGNFDVKQLTKGAEAVAAGFRRRRAVLDRRRPFRARRWRGLRHRGRDGRHRRGALQGPQRSRRQADLPGPVFSHPRLFCRPQDRGAREFSRRHGHADQRRGRDRERKSDARRRNAVLNMIALLQERGFSREQAYVICSVAVDLRISNVVDVPNYVVSALLPEAIFSGD